MFGESEEGAALSAGFFSFQRTELNPKYHGSTASFPLIFLGHLYHLFIPFPPMTRHYCSFLMCPTTEDKVCHDKWAPKIQHYFTDCFFWFWCIKWVGDVGMKDTEQFLAQPAGWRRFSLSLKGDYEGENVEPNDRKVSWCTGGFSIYTRIPAWRVTCWNLHAFAHRKCCKKALNAWQFKEKVLSSFSVCPNVECSMAMYKAW